MNSLTRMILIFLALLASGAAISAATVPEPSTVIYGKVLHRTHGNEYRLTEGSLVWTLRDQSGATYTYTAELEDIKGVFSYKLSIPHQALSSGLTVDSSVIPLRNGETQYDFVSIQVNGAPAAVLWSGTDFLKLLQKSRAATHRIDLEVSFDLADTDKDGMPDWWEILHGLDWQTADGHLDLDGDGWSNLNEFRGGTNPKKDDRVPSLHTRELAAYGESDNGVWLRAIDADSSPTDLIFTLTGLPSGGELHFDDGSETGLVLELGDTFVQQEINDGRLTFRHSDPEVTETGFSISLSDGVHTPIEAGIAIAVFAPGPAPAANAGVKAAPAWWRDENAVFEAYWGMRENVLSGDFVESILLYYMGRNYDWTLWDERAHTLPVNLQASRGGSHFMLGGKGDDVLVGSDQDDILAGGGGTNRLRGGGGRDLFMMNHAGLEIIEDFSEQEDVLDLSSLVIGKTGSLNAYLQAGFNGTHTELRLNLGGVGSNFSDGVVRLEGIELNQDDLHRLWSRGQLLLGSVQGFASVSIDGWPAASLEEGHSTADLVIRRAGPVGQPLTVSLAISGSATNGVDYESLPYSVSFAAGKSTVPLLIKPLVDGVIESSEQLNLGIAPGANYVMGDIATGQIRILDAQQRFSIVAVDEFAVADEDPGYLRIVRQGPRNGVVELLLSFSGTAVRGSDYLAIPSLVTFNDQQASRLIPVQALSLGGLSGEERSKTLAVTLRPPFEDEYLLGSSPSASIRLLSERQSFEQWAADAIPEVDPSTTTRSALAEMPSPRTGLNVLLEYASSYGLNLQDGVNPQELEILTPKLARDEGGWHFEFSKRLNDPRLEYIIERSSDFVEWKSDPSFFKPIPLDATKENAGRVRYRVMEPDGKPLPFMRVRVNLKD